LALEQPPAAVVAPLVCHHGALGDTIQLTAALRVAAERWGRPCDVVTGGVPSHLVLAGLPFVGTVRRLHRRRSPFLLSPEQWRLLAWLRNRDTSGPCYVIERHRHRVAPWSSATRFEWLLARAGVPAAHRVHRLDRGALEHAVDYFARVVGCDPPGLIAPAAAVPAGLPELRVTAGEREDCRAWIAARGVARRQLVLLQVSSRRRTRGRWPPERWAELARGILARHPDVRLLLIGTAGEQEQTQQLERWIDDSRVLDCAGDLPLRRLFALLTMAHSLISLDSAPAHAAAALDCPVVVLVGTADPRRNRPLSGGAPVELVTAFEGAWPVDGVAWAVAHDCARIAVPAVLAAWERLAIAGVRQGAGRSSEDHHGP